MKFYIGATRNKHGLWIAPPPARLADASNPWHIDFGRRRRAEARVTFGDVMGATEGQSVLGLDAVSAARLGAAYELAAAYEKAVSILSLNDHSRLPPASRTMLLKAMLRHGQIYGFDENRLALAGLASAPPADEQPDILGPTGPKSNPAAGGAALRRARGIRLPRRALLIVAGAPVSVAIVAALLTLPALAAPLTPAQSRLIALLTYIQASRDHCGYLIDVDLLRKTAADVGVTFTTPEQAKTREDGFADAEKQFAGLRRSVECAYALERFEPTGSKMAGLIARRTEQTQ